MSTLAYRPKVHLRGRNGMTACGRRASDDAKTTRAWPSKKVEATTDVRQVTCQICRSVVGVPEGGKA